MNPALEEFAAVPQDVVTLQIQEIMALGIQEMAEAIQDPIVLLLDNQITSIGPRKLKKRTLKPNVTLPPMARFALKRN